MRLFRIVRAILREIFDEAPFERFCARQKMGLTRQAYAQFLEEPDQARHPKIRCC